MGTATKDPRALEEAIRNTREQLQSSLGELRGEMDRTLEWRTWVRRHPWGAIGIATFLGFRLGRGRRF